MLFVQLSGKCRVTFGQCQSHGLLRVIDGLAVVLERKISNGQGIQIPRILGLSLLVGLPGQLHCLVGIPEIRIGTVQQNLCQGMQNARLARVEKRMAAYRIRLWRD